MLVKYKYHLKTKINTPVAILKIKNPGEKKVTIDRDLADLLGINRVLGLTTKVKNFKYPTTYFIHCNLIDKNQNFLNNKRSDVLSKLDLKGKPYEKVSYEASTYEPFRKCSTDLHVYSITVSVRNHDGELFDFNGFPLEFVLEIK